MFLTDDILKGTDWRALERAVARLMICAGWSEVSVVGRSGDMGADIIGVKRSGSSKRIWVVQVKAVTGGNYIGVSGLNEVMQAQSIYRAHVAVLATNGDVTNSVLKRRDELTRASFDVRIWNGAFLTALLNELPEDAVSRSDLRPYQKEIVDNVMDRFLGGGNKVQYVVATGLGKTVIAANISRKLWQQGIKRQLVLCHAQDLALQLEQSFWSYLTKDIPTRYFFDGIPPILYDGINFGLYQSLLGYMNVAEKGSFNLVVVDEAHHALAHGFRSCLETLNPKFLVGMTATPWRGDGRNIDEIFGEPIARLSLVDGMQMGFLSQVDYRLLCDNLDWEEVSKVSKSRLNVKDLNKRLFLPQRDEAIIQKIKESTVALKNARIAVFSPSIEHSMKFARLMSASGLSCESLSGVDRVERRRRLLDFSSGKLIAVTAVDVLNEGIDVPEVNVLVFLRATHSRRIFVQQLGRGLRLSPGKDSVLVLDFVSDIRRIAGLMAFDSEAREIGAQKENVYLKNGIVKFSDSRITSFVSEWLRDVSDVESRLESEPLSFPEVN